MTGKTAVRGGRPTPPAPEPVLRRVLRGAAYALLAVLGFAVAVAGALVQDGWFPFGLLLAVAGCAAVFYGGAVLTRTRAGAVVPAGVWMITVIGLTMSRSEGDAVFSADLAPYLYLLLGATSGIMAAFLPQFPPVGGENDRPGR